MAVIYIHYALTVRYFKNNSIDVIEITITITMIMIIIIIMEEKLFRDILETWNGVFFFIFVMGWKHQRNAQNYNIIIIDWQQQTSNGNKKLKKKCIRIVSLTLRE